MPEEQSFQRRQTAYKVRIKDILDSKYIKNEGFIPNYLQVGQQEVSRVNIIGIVVQKSETDNYTVLTIDDGTGKISARVFENSIVANNIGVGNVVVMVGKPREFSSEKYILIETIRNIDPEWAKVRKLELSKLEQPTAKTPVVQEGAMDLTPANKILKMIKELDRGDGVSIEDLASENTGDTDKIIDMLLKEGDVFEVKPGKIKILE